MSAEENKALVRRLIAGRNKGKTALMDAMDELLATDVIYHAGTGEVIQGLQDLKQSAKEGIEQYLNQHFTIDDMVAEGDKVAVRWTMTGTRKTNKTVTLWGIGISRIVNGKIVERWGRWDTLGVQQQLGLIPTPQKG